MTNTIRNISLFLIIALLGVSFAAASFTDEFSPEKAKKVDLVLKQIAKTKKHHVFLKKISFTQEELNSYLNLVYVKKYTPEVKYIKLKLSKKNYVSGTIKVKLVGKKYSEVPAFLRDVEIAIGGKVECQNYRMRFLFDEIIINGTTFSPEILDEAFGAAQANFRVKKSMYDWFSLMPGIKNIVIDYKKITIFY